MTGIAQQVEIFNRSFERAWSEIGSNLHLTPAERSRAALVIRDAIQKQLKAGILDPIAIATTAVEEARVLNSTR